MEERTQPFHCTGCSKVPETELAIGRWRAQVALHVRVAFWLSDDDSSLTCKCDSMLVPEPVVQKHRFEELRAFHIDHVDGEPADLSRLPDPDRDLGTIGRDGEPVALVIVGQSFKKERIVNPSQIYQVFAANQIDDFDH